MKILIIGATGNTGFALLKMASSEGHEVTAFVRNREKLEAMLRGSNQLPPHIVEGDVLDSALLGKTCRGQDAVVNVAGNVADGEQFVELVDTVTQAVETGLGDNGRFWFFGGVAALDVPGTRLMTVNLPKIPAMFRAHEENYRRVKASTLNWSMLCPGPMIASANGMPHRGLRISTEIWPVSLPRLTRYLPRIATSLAFKRAMPELTVCYEDAARVVLDNLEPTSPLRRKRVGLALPVGVTQEKDISGISD